MDHEILNPRSTAGEFADKASCRQRAHGLLQLVAQPDLPRSRRRLRRLSAQGPHTGNQRGARHHRGRPGTSRRLLHRRDAGGDRGGRHGARQRRPPQVPDPVRRADGLHVLESCQMAGTFHLMRSNDLIWSRVINHYLMGESDKADEVVGHHPRALQDAQREFARATGSPELPLRADSSRPAATIGRKELLDVHRRFAMSGLRQLQPSAAEQGALTPKAWTM